MKSGGQILEYFPQFKVQLFLEYFSVSFLSFFFPLSNEWGDWDPDQELVQVTLDMQHVFGCVTMCCD